MTRRKLLGGFLVVVAGSIGVLASGIVTVGPGEVIVVRRLGRVLSDSWGPGLHLGLPRGLDRYERLRLEEVRKIEVGLAGLAGPNDDPGAGEYLTGDLNLLRTRAVVQYRVSDPLRFVLAADRRDDILDRLCEASLARVLTRTRIDGVLRDQRPEVSAELLSDLEKRASQYGLGVRIMGVSLTDVQVPIEVQPDFAAAQTALSDKERRQFEAKTRAETMMIAAKGSAKAIDETARSEARRTVELANARASRFIAILSEFQRARSATAKGLYLTAIRDMTTRVRRKIVTPDEPVDLSVIGGERPAGSR